MSKATPLLTMNRQQWRKKILSWHQKKGRHHLPWQNPRTPYRVWISEIMLQQTQVATVIPYFEKFMNRFPSVQDLANADLDEVLGHWAGLGYYARARHLQVAAQRIVKDYQGIIPNHFDDLITLPGIGRSTAGAILSLGYEKPAAILDGNVKRILARTHGISFLDKHFLEKLWELAESYISKNQPQAYTQALMDLGALICKRTNPLCETCPLKDHCYAFQHQQIQLYPKPVKLKTVANSSKTIKKSQFLLFYNEGREVFLYQRPLKGIWGGLWSLIEKPEDSLLEEYSEMTSLSKGRHTFTHFHLDYEIKLVKWESSNPLPYEKGKWVNQNGYAEMGLPSLIKKVLQKFYENI